MFDFLEQVQPRMILTAMLAVCALTGLASYLYVFKAPLAEYAQLRGIHTQAIADIESEQRGVDTDQIGSMETAISKLREQLYGKGARLPPSQMVSYIIGQLDRLSGRHRVQLVSVKPGSTSRVLSFEEVPFDVEVSGAYFDLFSWLQDAEAELRPMVVKQFQIADAGTEKGLTIKMRVVSYRSPRAS